MVVARTLTSSMNQNIGFSKEHDCVKTLQVSRIRPDSRLAFFFGRAVLRTQGPVYMQPALQVSCTMTFESSGRAG